MSGILVVDLNSPEPVVAPSKIDGAEHVTTALIAYAWIMRIADIVMLIPDDIERLGYGGDRKIGGDGHQ